MVVILDIEGVRKSCLGGKARMLEKCEEDWLQKPPKNLVKTMGTKRKSVHNIPASERMDINNIINTLIIMIKLDWIRWDMI